MLGRAIAVVVVVLSLFVAASSGAEPPNAMAPKLAGDDHAGPRRPVALRPPQTESRSLRDGRAAPRCCETGKGRAQTEGRSARERISHGNLPTGWQWPPSAAMRVAGERCMQSLTLVGIAFQTQQHAPGRIATPVVVPSMNFAGLAVRQLHGTRAPVMDCHMALALARHASMLKSLGIRGLVVAGFFQNRRARLRGRTLPILSRHALGLAVDIRAFVTDDGRTLSVRDYDREPLFQRVETELISHGQLRAVVTPHSDLGHRSHFHISATMLIDGQRPEASVNVAEILRMTK